MLREAVPSRPATHLQRSLCKIDQETHILWSSDNADAWFIDHYAQRRESLRLSTACGKVDIQRLKMRCSVWTIDLHRSSHRRARSRPLPCHSQRHSQCWQQGASLAVPSQGRILEAPRTPPEAAPARRSPAVAAATGNPGHSLASRIQVARGCSKNAKDFGLE